MFYAEAHIFTPPAVVRPVAPHNSISLLTKQPIVQVLPNSKTQATAPSKKVRGSVFEMPPHLPAFLKKQVVIPVGTKSSEFAALASVSQQIGVPFSHTGPDYALYGTKVPFGKPVPAYEFLWYVGKSYVPGTVNINGSGSIMAANQKTNS